MKPTKDTRLNRREVLFALAAASSLPWLGSSLFAVADEEPRELAFQAALTGDVTIGRRKKWMPKPGTHSGRAKKG